MSMSTLPGFVSPVADAQTVFRAALAAFSRPGLPVPLAARHLPPAVPGLGSGPLALALALCDRDTPLWLDKAADTPQARHHLRFHCAAPLAGHPAQAAFAFISNPADLPRLAAFNPGRADFPDRSATLVIDVSSGCAGGAKSGLTPGLECSGLELTGPGVKGNDRGAWQSFNLPGLANLPGWFWADWAENRAAYPLGVDVLFVCGAAESAVSLLGLPRTSRVRKLEPVLPAKERSACM